MNYKLSKKYYELSKSLFRKLNTRNLKFFTRSMNNFGHKCDYYTHRPNVPYTTQIPASVIQPPHTRLLTHSSPCQRHSSPPLLTHSPPCVLFPHTCGRVTNNHQPVASTNRHLVHKGSHVLLHSRLIHPPSWLIIRHHPQSSKHHRHHSLTKPTALSFLRLLHQSSSLLQHQF